MSEYKGIPTVGPRGIQFRSRIEAQWAYLFEEFGWNWEYEPIDLNGYIPDFIITFPNNKQLLIEVKGICNIWDKQVYIPHAEKIIKSGWRTNYLIVGANYKKGSGDGWINIGIGDCGQYTDNSGTKQIEKGEIEGGEYCLIKKIKIKIETSVILDLDKVKRGGREGEEHLMEYIMSNKRTTVSTNEWDIFGNEGIYALDINGTTEWKEYDWNAYEIFEEKWANAKNKVQWKGKVN